MITIIVSVITSVVTTAALYYILHRANPTATQVLVDSTLAKASDDAQAVGDAVKAEVAKIV